MQIFRTTTVALLAILTLASVAAARPGVLDPTFGKDGITVTKLPPGVSGSITALVLQGDGKIVAVSDDRILRYLPDGTLDSSYGVDGVAAFGEPIAIFPQLALLDGDVLLMGRAYGGVATLERRLPDGTLDPSFGTGGILTSPLPGNIVGLAVQPDGKLLVAGSDIVMRFDSDGSVDQTFGQGGASNAAGFPISAMALQSDGAIVIGTTSGSAYGTHEDFLLSRLDADGNLDPTFGVDGYAQTDVLGQSYDYLAKLVPQLDSVLAIGRSIDSHGEYWFAVVRYVNGVPEPLYGGGLGFTVANFQGQGSGGNFEFPYWAGLDADGNLVVVGSVVTSYSDPGDPFAIVRFEPSGTLDATFGTGGKVLTYFPDDASSSAAAIASDGTIVVGGTTVDASGTQFDPVLARYAGNGAQLPRCAEVQSLACSALPVGGKAQLTIKNNHADQGDSLTWQWMGGDAGGFGDPLATDAYALCLYHEQPGTWPPLRFSAAAPPGGTCGSHPCWKLGSRGVKYGSKTGAPLGVTSLQARNSNGKTKLLLKGHGADLGGLNVLPFARPLTVEMHAGERCWSVTFNDVDVVRSDEGGMKLTARR